MGPEANREVMPQPTLGPDKEDKELGAQGYLSAPPPLPQKLIRRLRMR